MANVSQIGGNQLVDVSKLPKLTYEWNKEISFGSSGYLLIGKFPMYDSNITIDINSTTTTTYHCTLVIATQNINTSRGGTYVCNTYGDVSDTATSIFKVQYSSGSNKFNVYFQPASWSKNIVHIRCTALAGAPTESEICTQVSSVPTADLLTVTNLLKSALDGKLDKSGGTMTGDLRVGSSSIGTNGYIQGTWLKTSDASNLNATPTEYPVLSGGWIYKRTLAQTKSDLGIDSKADTSVVPSVVYCTCATDAATAAKVVTVSSTTKFELTAGTIIGVKFTYSNTASSPTLNVGETGAKSIYYNTAVYTGTSNQIAGYAGRTIYYMYNGTYWVWISQSYISDQNTVPAGYCVTAAGTAAKAATWTSYNLLAKSYGIMTMGSTNTYAGAITMNINGKGAKPIYINGSASSSSNYTLPAGTYIFYYDGSKYYFRTDGKIEGLVSTSDMGLTYTILEDGDT